MSLLQFCTLASVVGAVVFFALYTTWESTASNASGGLVLAAPSGRESTAAKANDDIQAVSSVQKSGQDVSAGATKANDDIENVSSLQISGQDASASLQYHGVSLDVKREGEDVHLVVNDQACEKLASWKYGQRVAFFFGKFCSMGCRGFTSIRNDCLMRTRSSISSLCIMLPDPANPCHVTEDDKMMWKALKTQKLKSMVDIGTNIGDSASMFPHWGIEVWGFDPMPDNLFWLKLNQRANRMSGVSFPLHIFDGGASNRDADLHVSNTGSSGSTHLTIEGHRDTADTVVTHVYRVSDHIKQRVGLFKMDCEGHEPEALQGAIELLCTYGAEVLVFEYFEAAIKRSSQVSPKAFEQLVSQLGFKCNLNYLQMTSGRHDVICKQAVAPSESLCKSWVAPGEAAPTATKAIDDTEDISSEQVSGQDPTATKANDDIEAAPSVQINGFPMSMRMENGGIKAPDLERDLVAPPDLPYHFRRPGYYKNEQYKQCGNSCHQGYVSKSGQDKWVDGLLRHLQGGFIVESGAHDAERISNSLFLETHRKWKCLLVEPNPGYASKILEVNRKCSVLLGGLGRQAAPTTFPLLLQAHISRDASKMSPEQLNKIAAKAAKDLAKHKFDEDMKFGRSGGTVNVAAYPLHMVLEKMQVTTVDYWSLDTEGTELDIIKATDFSSIEVGVMTVEVAGFSSANGPLFKSLLFEKAGLKFVRRVGEDLGFANPAYFKRRGLDFPS